MLPDDKFERGMLLAVVVAAIAWPWLTSGYYVELATAAAIAAMLALSMQLLVGCTGLVSLGHAAFYGMAAYAVYLVSPETAGPASILLTLTVAVTAAGIAAFLVGILSLRTKGFFFLMVTLAFGQMFYFVFHDTMIGGGTDGAYLAKPAYGAFGWAAQVPGSARSMVTFYVCAATLLAIYLGLARLMASNFGRALEGIRVNEHRMQALGFDTYRIKLVAFVIAGMLAGVSGHMWALHRGFVNPELLSWHGSAETLLMILLGGLGSLAGAVVGALAWTALGEVSQLITERKLLVEGLVVLAVVLVLRRGLMGLFDRRNRSTSVMAVEAASVEGAGDDSKVAAMTRTPAREDRGGGE